MKALTLYIDKWYIIGAVCTDGVPRLIKPRNNEDCFWLYFYEDVANDEIVYGKNNKRHFHNNENHYYGDIFSLIVDKSNCFYRFGRKQTIEKIFKASGILDELKDDLDIVNGKIETYISFASDISDAARVVFLQDVLVPENFDVKVSVARIGHLALEHAHKSSIFNDKGYYLLLNACNENLLYSLYEYRDNLFLRKAERRLLGMGTDLRSRALLENVVKSINNRNHFLQSEQEYETEYLRLAQFVDDWIVRLSNARPGRPIVIPNVTFSHVGNAYSATVLKKDIDARTHAIVDEIIREIITFVRESGITTDLIKGVLFLGDTFTNSQFLAAIREQYALPENHFVYYKKQDLPNIVAVYTAIDCSQFTSAAETSKLQGEAELERQRIAREEEERQQKAEEERIKKEEEEREAREADRRYEEAMRNVFDNEKKHEYAQMEEWAGIALKHKPDDAEALQKKNDAMRLLSEQKVKEEQYRSIIGRAQTSFNEGDWQEALAQSNSALNIKPESAEAKRIYNEAKRHLETEKDVEKFINRADLFFAQRSFVEALEELKKVLSLDSDNQTAITRIAEIQGIMSEHEQKVQTLITRYNEAKSANDFNAAIEACEKLVDLDSSNQRKWSIEAERLKSQQEKFAENKRRFQDLKKKAMDADFKEDWASFVSYAEQALEISDDSMLSQRLTKAKQKLETQAKENEYQREINHVRGLIDNNNMDEAQDVLNRLQRQYPSHANEIKELRKRTFQFDSQRQRSKSKEEDHRPIGFNIPQKEKKPADEDFFGSPKPAAKPPKRSPASPKTTPKPKTNPPSKTGIDFFDMDVKPKNNNSNTNDKFF